MVRKYPAIIPGFPHLLHGADYNPEQWSHFPGIREEDFRLARLAGLNSFSVGIFSWAALEIEEGVYDFAWLDTLLDRMAQEGMKAVLATPSGARPAWMSQKYPEVLRTDADRVQILHGKRHNHCYTSPIYRQKVTEINTLLAQRYGDHPALGIWHVSNEYGGECHCPLCQAAFRAWLRERYQDDLDLLNQSWWTAFWSHTYTDWEQIESPSPRGETAVHGLNLDWKRFVTHQTRDFLRCEIEPLKAYAPDIPVTTNLMRLFEPLDYFKLAQDIDVVSWDSYPRWMGDEDDLYVAAEDAFCHDMNRGYRGGQPFLLMESCPSATNWQEVGKLRRPGGHKLYSVNAVAHGADSVQYFQFRKSRGAAEKFHGAVVDHEGSENTRVFREVASVGQALTKLDALVGCNVPARTAIVYDWENRWALEDAKGFQKDKKYVQTLLDNYLPFFKNGVPVDVIDREQPLEGYSLLVAPMLYMVDDAFAGRVEDFVRRGGTFVCTYMSGYVEEHDLCHLGGFPGPIKEVLGIWCEEMDALRPEDHNAILWNGKEYPLKDMAEMIHLRGARQLGVYASDFYAGHPALTCNDFGEGRAYFIGARMDETFNDDFYAMVIATSGVRRVLDAPLPRGVSACLRSDGNEDFIFVMNFMPSEAAVNIGPGGMNMENGEFVGGRIMLPARGLLIYRRPARKDG